MIEIKRIITEIEKMLQKKQIAYDSLTHLTWIEQRANGKLLT